VSFLVWAPFAGAVSVVTDTGTWALETRGDGYFGSVVAELRCGARYRFSLDGGEPLGDPASRYQPEGVHGPSEVIDLGAHRWQGDGFEASPWAQQVISEVHIGALTDPGTFDAAIARLDALVDVGISAIEIMPVAQFPGTRNWGYDGVFPYAVQDSYGGPAGLQRLVDACHARGLTVILDVVYNHIGPEGNVLGSYGPYFTDRYTTPWGPAINLDGPGSDQVRSFLTQNALMWFEDFHIDGLRLDAVHELIDRTAIPFLVELSGSVRDVSGRRRVLIAESADNDPRVTTPVADGGRGFDAQWSDDFHHTVHAVVTGERFGYYADFGSVDQIAIAVESDFVYAGQHSVFRDRRHGAPVGALPTDRFVHYISDHDQIGNRPDAARLASLVPFERLRVALALLLLAPGVPMLFMGDEYGETAPFPYFVDHGDPQLLEAVRRGRAAEFADAPDGSRSQRYDPGDPGTLVVSRLQPERRGVEQGRVEALVRQLLELRRTWPALTTTEREAVWCRADGTVVTMVRRDRPGGAVAAFFNFGSEPGKGTLPEGAAPWRYLIGSHQAESGQQISLELEPWSFCAYGMDEAEARR
jgi:maltooligosyltrehalose trehalohydrolase